jgi:ubiquitin C-terminal hydrolase
MLCLFFRYAKLLTEQKITPTHLILPKLNSIWPKYVFSKKTQEDSNELLTKLLDAMTDACFLTSDDVISTRMGYAIRNQSRTPIQQIFGGQSRSQIQCLECKNTSSRFEEFNCIHLDIPAHDKDGEFTFEERFNSYCSTEMLVDENQYECMKCNKKSDAKKRFSVEKSPRILIIQVLRFDN